VKKYFKADIGSSISYARLQSEYDDEEEQEDEKDVDEPIMEQLRKNQKSQT
jgi:hypothetical protein